MKDWFDTFSRQYFEEEYDSYYIYDHYKQLHPFKNIKITSIEDNCLRGYVKHGKYEYNTIKINFKLFTEDEKNKLKSIIEENPINKFKIINKTLPSDLLNSEINFLPESIDDLDITCSMEDEKENLIDILSILKDFNRRLEKNNFLIFKIRGLDLTRKIDYPIKSFDDLLEFNFKSNSNNKDLTDLSKTSSILLKNVSSSNQSFDFIYDELFELLNKEIELFSKNSNTQKSYTDFETYANTTFESVESKNSYFTDKWDIKEDIVIDINSEYEITNTNQFKDEEKLFAFVNELNQVDIEFNEKQFFLKDLLKLTYTLVGYNSIMPELFKTDTSYVIRWIPSFYNDNVVNYCNDYFLNCPDNLVTVNQKNISKKNQVIILITLLMNSLIRRTINKNKISSFENVPKITFNLFTGKKLKIENTQYEKSISKISRQLKVFYLNELDFTYALFMDEDYNVEIKIKEDNIYTSIIQATEDELKYIGKIYDLFTYFKIDNTMYEGIKLSNKDFIIFSKNIIELLPYINVELHFLLPIINSGIDLILDIDSDHSFKLNDINRYSQWKVVLDDCEIPLAKFDRITDDMNEIIRYNDKIYIVDGYSFRTLKYYAWSLSNCNESNKILQYAILGEYDDLKFKLSDNFKKFIASSKIYEQPKSLTGQLRPYQKIGFSWLIQNIKSGFGSILADDMGLGKTLQVLSAILYFKQENPLEFNPSLIIVPPTLLSNWQQEIEKFTPQLSYYIYHGQNRVYPVEDYDILLTSYSVLRLDLDQFMDKKWFICVIDEAQNIKNPGTKQTRAIKEIPAFNKIALTGTPIENRLTDYWSIFDFVNRGYLSTLEDFKSNYVYPIEKVGNEDVLNNLRTIAKPFVLRRLKSDDEIRKELPEKIVNDMYCTLTTKQIHLYNTLLDGLFDKIIDIKGIERKGTILKLITALKQTCNHPAQYLKSDKMKINESGKMELLLEILENILDMDEKVLIFTQYVEMGKIIQKLISQKLKKDVLFLHGTLSRKEKTDIIDSFQEDSNYKILVATLKTGGTGLNLTAAQNVIHYDLWWNPAVENQATDRVHRIGQENDVMVYRFITKGTLEESIDEMLKNKIDLADKTISTDETFITELSNEELKKILSLRL